MQNQSKSKQTWKSKFLHSDSLFVGKVLVAIMHIGCGCWYSSVQTRPLLQLHLIDTTYCHHLFSKNIHSVLDIDLEGNSKHVVTVL